MQAAEAAAKLDSWWWQRSVEQRPWHRRYSPWPKTPTSALLRPVVIQRADRQ